MNSYEIIANGKHLDTFESETVSLNYQIEDILNIEKRNTNFSKTIRLPGTKSNNLFFKQIFDVNIDNINFNPSVSIPASITIGGNTVMSGNLQLKDISIVNGEVQYSISIFGNLKNIIDSFGDYTLQNLDLSEYNHTRDKSDIESSWEYTVRFNGDLTYFPNEGRGYVYPYIINGNSTDIFDTAYIYDLYPAVYVKTYIDKLFEFSGFTYKSRFFESDYFKKLIIPFNGDKLTLDTEELNERKAIVSNNGNDPDNSDYSLFMQYAVNGTGWNYNSALGYQLNLDRESGTVTDGSNELTFTDELGQWDGDIFTCTNAGRYDINFNPQVFPKVIRLPDGLVPPTNIQYNTGEFQYSYFLQLVRADGTVQELDSSRTDDEPNGTQYFTFSSGTHNDGPASGINNAIYWIDTDSQIAMGLSADNVFMSPGDKIRVLIGLNQPSAVNWAGDDINHLVTFLFKESFDGVFTKMVITPSTDQSYGNEDVDLNSTLPNIKIKDFFLNIVKMFNLIVLDDEEGNLIIEPRDDFFKSKQKVKDWTQLLDRESEVKIIPMSELDAREYLYTYTPDDDLYNKDYTDETKESYGQLSVTVQNDFSNKTSESKILFSPTPVSDYQINGRVAPFFVEKDDEGLKAKKVKPRILFYNGLIDGDLILKDHQGDVSPEDLTQYPYVGMWDNPTNPENDLGFGATRKIYFNSSVVPTSNLYNKFHKSTLKNIIDKNARLLEGLFKLTPSDIKDFDFRDIIFIDGSYWRVNTIKDFDPIGSDKLTKVVLYKIIDLNVINKYQVELPESNKFCPSDVRIIRNIQEGTGYYASASGLPISEACCSSLGGNWDGSVCRLTDFSNVGEVSTDGALITSGNTMPTKEDGTQSQQKDNNTIGANGIKVYGSQNFVPEGAEKTLIIGDNNSLSKTAKNTVIIGDDIIANDSDTIYFEDFKINEKGVQASGDVIIDSGEDLVFPVLKTNEIDLIDGGIDSVRNYGGDSKKRPIIDGGYESIRDIEP